MNRLAYVDALVGVTADGLARDVDAASTPNELYTAVRSALHLLGPGAMAKQPEDTPLTVRVQRARTRVGLTTSEQERKAAVKAAELQMAQKRAARRAS